MRQHGSYAAASRPRAHRTSRGGQVHDGARGRGGARPVCGGRRRRRASGSSSRAGSRRGTARRAGGSSGSGCATPARWPDSSSRPASTSSSPTCSRRTPSRSTVSLLPGCVVVRLTVPLEEAWRRASTRPVWLTDDEFVALHEADALSAPAADHEPRRERPRPRRAGEGRRLPVGAGPASRVTYARGGSTTRGCRAARSREETA